MKYVLVSGGVISGIGKGVIASSAGLLLKTIGLKVSSIKIDPYLNVDAGTMKPTEHGECFVLDDGGEVDLDLGNYERYLNITLTRDNNITTGKIYQHVIERERKGEYLGKTVQVVPHLTNALQDWIERVARISVDDTGEEPDVCIIELGGTVGDIESAPFVEAMRQLRVRAGRNNFIQIHVSLVPIINGEQKTKPTQQAIREVRSVGLSPDLIACRCDVKLEESTIEKVAMFCQVEDSQVVAVHNLPSTYHVPMLLEQQGLVTQMSNLFRLQDMQIAPALKIKGQKIWQSWKSLTTSQERYLDSETVTIALVGKYTKLKDSYLSVIRSLEHSAMWCHRKLNLRWVEASNLEKEVESTNPKLYHMAWHDLCTADGVLVPGGFGTRGIEGMIRAAEWARKNQKPYLGICLGMQIAVIEHARNICGIANAASEEIEEKALNGDVNETANAISGKVNEKATEHVIFYMPEIDREVMGGNMRVGLHRTIFQENTEWSKLRKLYGGAQSINERHRHRYEVNPKYIKQLADGGLDFIGKDTKGERMEAIELKDHPFFVGVQYHPEYLSRVLKPSPPYLGLVAASAGTLDKVLGRQAGGGVNGEGHGVMNGTTNGANDSDMVGGF